MALSVDASGRSCGSGTNVRVLVGPRKIISAGRMLSLLLRGFSPFRKLMSGHANPDEETTDWRAVCGRTACTVRRAGRARALSDPYQMTVMACTGELAIIGPIAAYGSLSFQLKQEQA